YSMEKDIKKRIVDFVIKVDSTKWAIIETLKMIFMKNSPKDAESLVESFSNKYEILLQEHEQEDKTDLSRYYRLIMEFKPALASIMKPGKEFDDICDIAVNQFNVVLNRIRRQINDKKGRVQKKGPLLPGSSKTIECIMISNNQ
ncbi:unnamed protein product, partial [marine sediment metagenome]